jgi:hypothetical protein
MTVVIALKTETGSGVGLRIAVDEQGFEPFERDAGGEIDGSSSFANPALLIHNAEYFSHGNQE